MKRSHLGIAFFLMIEKINFDLFGFELLEPMAFITNSLVTLVCLFGTIQSKRLNLTVWRFFFTTFAIASFSGALSHVFWNYWGFNGKIIPWLFGVISSGLLVEAMIKQFHFKVKTVQILRASIFLKGIGILFFAFSYWNFLFVAIDTIFSLFIACGIGTLLLYFHYQRKELYFMLVGFLVMLPSAAIFLLKLDLHLWLNREDLSHLFIAAGLFFFVLNLPNIALKKPDKNLV